MKKQFLTAASLLTVALIAGCGSGSGTSTSTTNSTPVSTTAIAGKVADGYLVGATVFLDKNGNYQMDAGEPFAITDQNGNYSMNIDSADLGKYPIVAMAIKGVTIDKDTGAAVTNSFVLSMPATAMSGTVSSNFISPMSSQVREMMETGKYTTMQQAMADLSAKLNMPASSNMLIDYMAANNTTMHTAAQNVASLMGSQMAQVMSGTSVANTTVDVNRYRGMMGTIFSNMSSIKGSNSQSGMTTLINNMMTNLPNIPAGQPFHNMSAAFRGGMMGGTGGMMK